MSVKRLLYLADRERVDEIVGDGWYHLEQMDHCEYYLGLMSPDGELVQITIVSDSPIRVIPYSHEYDQWPEGVDVEAHPERLA